MAGTLATGAIRIAAGVGNGYSGTQNNGGNGVLVVSVSVYEIGAQTLGATWDGVAGTALTLYPDGATHTGTQWFYWLTPATGSKTLVITGASSDRIGIGFFPTDGTSGAPSDSDGTVVTPGISLTRTVTTVAGDLVLATVAVATGADPTLVWTGDATQHSEGLASAADYLWQGHGSFAANDTSADMGVDFTGAANASFAVVVVPQAPAGPTINTQPVAGTVVLGESEFASKTFTVAATTSGGALSYQWQEEDSVGAGTYTNIANGGIYAGATSANLVLTPTTTAKTGFRYRCNVTDSNGTTTTSAVALTVTQGNSLTQPSATDSSGEFDDGALAATMALSSFAGQNGGDTGGWCQVVVSTVGGVEVARTTVQPKP